MNDRPSASNGKRYVYWGTTQSCPECGECLCFSCHPQGPCVDERKTRPVAERVPASFVLRPAVGQ